MRNNINIMPHARHTYILGWVVRPKKNCMKKNFLGLNTIVLTNRAGGHFFRWLFLLEKRFRRCGQNVPPSTQATFKSPALLGLN